MPKLALPPLHTASRLDKLKLPPVLTLLLSQVQHTAPASNPPKLPLRPLHTLRASNRPNRALRLTLLLSLLPLPLLLQPLRPLWKLPNSPRHGPWLERNVSPRETRVERSRVLLSPHRVCLWDNVSSTATTKDSFWQVSNIPRNVTVETSSNMAHRSTDLLLNVI